MDISDAIHAGIRVYFWLNVSDASLPDEKSYGPPRFRSNVWSHGVEAVTRAPAQFTPDQAASLLEPTGRVDVLWPHDPLGLERGIRQNTAANISVVLYDGLAPRQAAPAEWTPTVHLLKSLDTGVAEVLTGERMLVSANGIVYPTWVFDDVDVSAARNPSNRYYFRVSVDGQDVLTSVWTYGADGRTYFPASDIPEAGGTTCIAPTPVVSPTAITQTATPTATRTLTPTPRAR